MAATLHSLRHRLGWLCLMHLCLATTGITTSLLLTPWFQDQIAPGPVASWARTVLETHNLPDWRMGRDFPTALRMPPLATWMMAPLLVHLWLSLAWPRGLLSTAKLDLLCTLHDLAWSARLYLVSCLGTLLGLSLLGLLPWTAYLLLDRPGMDSLRDLVSLLCGLPMLAWLLLGSPWRDLARARHLRFAEGTLRALGRSLRALAQSQVLICWLRWRMLACAALLFAALSLDPLRQMTGGPWLVALPLELWAVASTLCRGAWLGDALRCYASDAKEDPEETPPELQSSDAVQEQAAPIDNGSTDPELNK